MQLHRIAVTAILLGAFLALSAGPARAQDNPPNPLGSTEAGSAGAALPRYLEGDGLILVIERTEGGGRQIEGRLIRGDQVFPCRATWESESSARGSFSSGEQSFDFTAVSGPDGSMVLRTGTAAYTLKQVARPSRPIPGDVGTRPGPATPVLPPELKQQAGLYTLIANLPGVSQLTAPEWLKPGMRISFWTGSATIKDQAFQTTLTPNATGDLVDPATGQRYSESSVPGGSGAVGFTQIDITGVSPELVVMEVSNFLHDGTMERPSLIGMTQIVCHPSGCEYWLHPAALRQLAAQGGFAFAGRRGQGDQMRDVVVVKDGNGHTVYDAASGVMLSFSMQTKNTGTETYYDPVTQLMTTRPKTGSMLAINQFRSIRETYRARLDGMKLPAFVDGLKGIEVERRETFRVDVAPGQQQESSMKLRIEPIGQRGNWVVLRTTAYPPLPDGRAGPPQSMTSVTTLAEVGGTFLPLDFLAGLQEGQILDEDPLTGYSTRVTRVGRTGDGRPEVVITRGGATEKSDWVYDARSGMMISLYKITLVAGSTTEVQVNVIRTW